MATNEHVINRSADDGMLICRSAECLQEPPTNVGYLCSVLFLLIIFLLLMTEHVVYNIDDTKAAGQIKTDIIL